MKTATLTRRATAQTLGRLAGLFVLLSVAMPSHSNDTNQTQPPWLQPDVLRAALEIRMSEEQLPNFKQALSNLVNGHQKALNRVLARNNVSNMKQKMKSASNRQFAKFDKAMLALLEDEQQEKYAVYRKLLKAKFTEIARNGGKIDSRSSSQINSALNGFSDSN